MLALRLRIAAQKERTGQEQAKKAERERDEQVRKDKGVARQRGGTLSGR